jgi:hypothetical protein
VRQSVLADCVSRALRADRLTCLPGLRGCLNCRHANNCEGISPGFERILRQIGQFAADKTTVGSVLFSPSPFDHVQCGPDK